MGKNTVNGPIQCRNYEYLSIKNKSLLMNCVFHIFDR